MPELPLWPDNPTSEDLLRFADVAEPIIEALGRKQLDPVAIGISGDWGSGKTTILEIIADKLPDDTVVVSRGRGNTTRRPTRRRP